MPIYEYECGACGHKHEALQKFSDTPLKQCPVCNEPQLKKLVSAAGFRLAGSGWYETDFKTSNKRNLAGNDTEPSQKTGENSASDSKNKKTADKPDKKPAKKSAVENKA